MVNSAFCHLIPFLYSRPAPFHNDLTSLLYLHLRANSCYRSRWQLSSAGNTVCSVLPANRDFRIVDRALFVPTAWRPRRRVSAFACAAPSQSLRSSRIIPSPVHCRNILIFAVSFLDSKNGFARTGCSSWPATLARMISSASLSRQS